MRYSNTPDEEMEAMNVELMLKDEEARRYKAALQRYHEGRSTHPALHEVSYSQIFNCYPEIFFNLFGKSTIFTFLKALFINIFE